MMYYFLQKDERETGLVKWEVSFFL